MSLRQSTIRGVLWNFTELLLRRGVSALTTLLLAYLLVPADFGLVSISTLFLTLAMGVMDSGLREAMIRRKNLSARLLKSAMIASLCLGFVAYLVLFFASPWIAHFYSEPRLTALVRVAGIQILIGAIQISPIAKLQQKLDFKSLMKASFPSALTSSLVAILLALGGGGVWALVIQTLIASAMTTIFVWRQSGLRFEKDLHISLLIPLYRFGYKLFLSGLIALTIRNMTPGLLGKFFGPTFSGYYFFVDKIFELIMGQFVYSVQNVTYPVFSKMGGKKEVLKEAYRKVTQVIVFIIGPILSIGSGLSDELFHLFFSPDWWPAAECFQWLCLAYLLYPLHALNLNIIKVCGRSDIFFRLEVVKAIIALAVLFLTLRHGFKMVLLGQIVVSLLCYLPNAMYSKSLINYSIKAQLIDVAPYFAFALLSGQIAALMAKSMRELPVVGVVFLSSIMAFFFYLGLAKLFKLQALHLLVQVTKSYRER